MKINLAVIETTFLSQGLGVLSTEACERLKSKNNRRISWFGPKIGTANMSSIGIHWLAKSVMIYVGTTAYNLTNCYALSQLFSTHIYASR